MLVAFTGATLVGAAANFGFYGQLFLLSLYGLVVGAAGLFAATVVDVSTPY